LHYNIIFKYLNGLFSFGFFHLDDFSIMLEIWIIQYIFLFLFIENVNSFLFSFFMLSFFDNHELIMRHSFFFLFYQILLLFNFLFLY